MLKYMIVREVNAHSNDGKKQMVVKLVLNQDQYVDRVCRRFREVLGEEKYTVDVHEAIKKAMEEINNDFEQEKLKFA